MKKYSTFLGLAALAAALLVSGPVTAQMGGGGMGGGSGSGGMGGGGNGQMGSGSMGSMGMPDEMSGTGHVLLTPDGVAILVSRTASASQATAPTAQVVALNPNGAVSWRWDASDPVHQISLATGLVLVSLGDADMQAGSTSTPTGALVALRSASGAEAWRYTADGLVASTEVSTDRILALVVKMTSTSNGGHMSSGTGNGMTRSLAAFDLSGHVLWTYGLDQ